MSNLQLGYCPLDIAIELVRKQLNPSYRVPEDKQKEVSEWNEFLIEIGMNDTLDADVIYET